MRHKTGVFAALSAAAALTACSHSSDDAAGTGTLSVSLMDRPVDGITDLYVTISEMWIKPRGDGPAIQLDMVESPITVNLLELGDENASVLVQGAVVDAGEYNWFEMKIEDTDPMDSYAMTDSGGMEDVEVDVNVPSGRVRIVSGFEVLENAGLRILFDWDVRKGLTEAAGQNRYLLRPAFRVLDVDEIGVISGTVSNNDVILAEDSCAGVTMPEDSGKVVYIFAGSDIEPDDMDGDAPEPVTTVDAEFNPATGDYDYRAVVMPGEYTVAFTCQGDLDEDDTSEDVIFIGTQNVDVPLGIAADAINFPASE